MATDVDVKKLSVEMCEQLLRDLEKAKRPVLEATKCSLDNSFYNPKVGYLTPGDKKVATELNVSSVQKMSRAIFMLELILRNLEVGATNTKRELYYISKGEIKHDPALKPLDFADQHARNAIIDFICGMMESCRHD